MPVPNIESLSPLALHPLLLAQIRSVRPEADFGPYMEWFSSEGDRHCRLFQTALTDAFSFGWSSSYFSWVFPPFGLVEQAAAKFLLEKARGCFIAPAFEHKWFNVMDRYAQIVFRMPATAFVAKEWKIALAHHPDREFVTRVIRGIDHGRSIGFSGTRMQSRLCKNPPAYKQYLPQLHVIFAKENAKGWRSGPFPGHDLPLFNLICSPVKGATKRFSEKIRQ
jgi:hypothetical protein